MVEDSSSNACTAQEIYANKNVVLAQESFQICNDEEHSKSGRGTGGERLLSALESVTLLRRTPSSLDYLLVRKERLMRGLSIRREQV